MNRVKPIPAPAPEVENAATIAQAIRAARTQAGLRQKDTAMLCGVSSQTLVDIEAGAEGVGIGLVLRVARSLGVRLFVLTGDDAVAVRHFVAKQVPRRHLSMHR